MTNGIRFLGLALAGLMLMTALASGAPVEDDLDLFVNEAGDTMHGDLNMGTHGVTFNSTSVGEAAPGTLGIAGAASIDGNLSLAGTLLAGAVPWARLVDFPGTCAPGEYVSALGAAPVCSRPADTTYSGADFALSGQACAAGMLAVGIDGAGAVQCAPAAWADLTGIPAGFADGVDADTTYTAGDGLTLTGGAFAVDPTVARRDVGQTFAGANQFTGHVSVGEGLDVTGQAHVRGTGWCDGFDANVYLGDANHGVFARCGGGVGLRTFGVDYGVFVKENTGDVGVGLADPTARLHVAGDLRFDGALVGGEVPFERVTGDVPWARVSGSVVGGLASDTFEPPQVVRCGDRLQRTIDAGPASMLVLERLVIPRDPVIPFSVNAFAFVNIVFGDGTIHRIENDQAPERKILGSDDLASGPDAVLTADNHGKAIERVELWTHVASSGCTMNTGIYGESWGDFELQAYAVPRGGGSVTIS